MNMRLRLPMALALALGTSHAYALGLGQIEVKSALNQPLVAEIPVLVSDPGEADALAVRLASPDAFARVGLERPAMQAANLSFEVQTDTRGRKVIRITTPNSVSDPFLSFLLEVDWGKGRMLREYTVLLDPPSMAPIAGSAPAVATAMPEPVAARAEPLLETPPPMPAPAPVPAPAPASEPVAAPAQPVYVPPAQETYPAYGADSYAVTSGDTLWSIAQRTRPDDSVTINQMMLALLRANPDAFIGDNINRLKKGAVLRIPGRDEATVMAAAEAAAQVRDQIQGWSGVAATMAQPAEASGTAPASARSARTAPDSRLELTPPRGTADAGASQSGAAADGTGRELRAELARTREEVSALSQENVELKSRVGELEAIQGESRRLIELKDSELAAVQRRLAEAEALASSSGEAVATAPAPSESMGAKVEAGMQESAEAASTELAADAGVADGVAGAVGADEGLTPDADAVVPSGAEDGVSEPAAVAEQAPAAEPLSAEPAPAPAPESGATGFNPWILGGGAAVLLGLVGLLLTRRKKAAGTDPAPAASVEDAPAVVAYGDADQEEGELIEAISQYPSDLQLHLDLLRHYYARNDADGFEMAAEAMYAQVYDVRDPAWREALSLGQQIAPEHPLFGTAAPSRDEAPYDEDFQETEEVELADMQGDIPTSGEAPRAEREIDWFDTGAISPAPQFETASELPDEDVSFEEEAVESIESAFESEFEPDPVSDAIGIDIDAAATKLELARAYMDMGDAEGARGMLEEVLTEGNAAQRSEARQLLDGIA